MEAESRRRQRGGPRRFSRAALARGRGAASPAPARARAPARAAALATALALRGWSVLQGAAGELSPVGISNTYYQGVGYFGSRVLEHNETGRFSRYVEATWSQHSAIDKSGRLWIVDRAYHQVVLVEPATRYVPFPSFYMDYAGTRGRAGFYDGIRTQALFDSPMGIALCESEGQSLVLYVSDTNNHVIRRLVFATGRVATIAGLQQTPGLQDGSSKRARFNAPMSLGVDSEGNNLFVLDNGRRIRHVDLAPAVAVVTTLVDGACRAVSRWTVPSTIVMRTVGCHPDWVARDNGDTDVKTYTFEVVCAGHQATCGPRRHPAIHDEESPYLEQLPEGAQVTSEEEQPSVRRLGLFPSRT